MIIARVYEQKQIFFVHQVKHDFVAVSVMLLPLSLSVSLPGSVGVTGIFLETRASAGIS